MLKKQGLRYIMSGMKSRGVGLIEIVVSMLILSVCALGVVATVAMVNSQQMRSAGGSSLDLQALSYARKTFESLKNAVSSNATRAAALENNTTGVNVTSGLPASFRDPPLNGRRIYTVSGIDENADGVIDYKKVTVSVNWTDQ